MSAVRSLAAAVLAAAMPSPATLDREALGRRVREVWIAWAREQPAPKASWLLTWEQLSERDREVNRRIGETIAVEALQAHAGLAVQATLLAERVLSGHRERLPDDRSGPTVKLTLGGRRYYVTVNSYDDGSPGEIFIHAGHAPQEGAVPIDPAPLLDALAQAISFGLQHGAPLEWFLQKLKATKFEPAGPTFDEKVPRVTSVLDYFARTVARLAGIDLDGAGEQRALGVGAESDKGAA